MEEDGEYADGEIVWVKLSYCWWPGEVLAGSRLTDEFLSTLKRRPLAVVKFFDEDSYEYVKNTNFIYKYNCSRKHEFLRKGLEQYRAKNKHMVKFPADVMQAERATGGDPNIVNSTEFLPQKRESYADIFSPDKSKGGKGKASASTPRGSPKKAPALSPSKIIPVIPVRKHEVRILGQASSPSGIASRSSLGLSASLNNSSLNASTSSSGGEPGVLSGSGGGGVSAVSPSQIYHCHKCGFESSRQNVIVLHTKYCRAVPLAPFNIPPVRESKSLQTTAPKAISVEPVTPKAAPKLPDEPPQQQPDAPEDDQELVEVIQVVQEKTSRSGRTPRATAKAATPTPKADRKKNRGGRGKAVATPEVEVAAAAVVAADEEKVEVLQVCEEPPVEETPVQEVGKSLDDSTGKDSKGKADVELKNELLADWSEDEQDEQEVKEDKRKAASSDELDKVESTEKASPMVVSVTDASAEKSVESPPQLASPVSSSSGTTIKYRNIPKKQKREFIEVTNDQPATTAAVTIEKSSSESSISTAATCGDKTASSSSADSLLEQSRPLSAKQRILDRATRGSSKSNSSSTEEFKPVVVVTAAAASEESQRTSEDTKKDIASCFDFKEEEEEEVVLNKSPRRSLSNRRDVSLDAKQEQEELERAKKDAELKNEIDSLLSEVTVPALPELPKLSVSPRAASPPGPSQDIISPQSKEEIDRNRTLPPKERGKRIFKTRNKPTVENEAIALEQSKAIVLDFVKKSHEEEDAQRQQEAKLSLESPTTTNDDSQESVLSAVAEPSRFENSEFAAIKAKRTKLPVDVELPKEEESTVSSSNEEPKPAPAEPESLPVSISKDQLTLEVLEKATTPSPKSRKGKQQPPKKTVVSPIVLIEKLPESEPEPSEEQHPEVTPKTARKKRASEMDQLDLTALDTPRSRRGRSAKAEESTPAEPEEPPKEIEPAAPAEKRKVKRTAKKEEEAAEETPLVEPKPSKSKRNKQSQQRSADSTADLHAEVDPVVPTVVEPAPAEPVVSEPAPQPLVEPPPVVTKHQPIKMIIKSKGKQSNSELIYDDPVVAPEPKPEETQEKLPKSPKSSKRKKEESTVEAPVEEAVEPLAKSPKSKRPKVKASEKSKEPEVSVEGPSATDLQVAEALIQLPEAPVVPAKVVDQEMVEAKSNNSSPVHAKTINPRKRHLQKLMDTAEAVVEQPKPEIVIIPEKKKRDAIVEVVSVAPATIVHDLPAKSTNVVVVAAVPDEDKFDIDNIPIVMDSSELLEDSTISTTSNSKRSTDDDVKLISTTKPMTKKIVIVKSSNGSAKIVGKKESSAVAKKSLALKSTTVTIKPPLDQLSPTTRSPAHSPTPIRSAQLVQASSGGQIVITSKGTVLTTQSPSTSTARSQSSSSSDGLKTHVSQSHSKPAIVSSVVSSASSISSSSCSTARLPEPAANSTSTTPQRSGAAAAAIKSPAKICVQSQEIIHPPTKPRPVVVTGTSSSAPASPTVVVQKVTTEVGSSHKKGLAATASQRKSAGKKHTDPGTSGGKPLFSTSKGALITPQPATASSANSGKKNHRVIKISPQKLKEFTRLGMVEDKGKGKVLTASGMKKFRQEQEQLLQQQQQQQQPQSKPDKPIQRADSVDEEPSTSTPTPPPPSDAPAEVVVAAAADSSVKELPPASSPAEPEQSPEVADEEPAKPEIVEENEAAAAETEPECSSSSKVEPVCPVSEEASESASAQPEAPAEASSESSSNVQESSQLIAVPAENFGGPANLFYLCSVREEGFVPVNNELLYLDSSNQLVALPEQASVEDIVQQAAAAAVQEVLEIPGVAGEHATVDVEGAVEAGQQNILLNTQDGQQIILDQQSLMALAAAGADTSQLLTPDGQQIVLQGSAQELLAALAVTQPGLGIAVAAEGTQIIVAPESLIDLQDAPLPGEIIQVNPNTTVETNAVLTKPPIMSTVEVPSKNGNGTTEAAGTEKPLLADPVAATNLDESLAAVIGVPGNPNVPTSLELPITVTNPVIAKTTTSKINPIYQPTTAIAAIPGVLDLPPTALAQTGTDSTHVETTTTHEGGSSSDDTKAEKEEEPTTANGKSGDDDDHDVDLSELDDEIIPNTPESQMNSHADISSQFSDDDEDDDASMVPLPRVADDDDDNSNFSDVIPIQPNVILRNINNELSNNNENSNNSSSDMELDPAEPGNEENDPNQQTAEVATGSANNNSLVER
uniref:Putative titin n=1 Tax=Culex tarsalis TaxID=7177 RepID=A0A1Q3F211_CULTA